MAGQTIRMKIVDHADGGGGVVSPYARAVATGTSVQVWRPNGRSGSRFV